MTDNSDTYGITHQKELFIVACNWHAHNSTGIEGMNDKGYGIVYDHLAASGVLLRDMLEQLPTLLKGYTEQSASDIVRKFGCGNSNDQHTYETAINYLWDSNYFDALGATIYEDTDSDELTKDSIIVYRTI